MPEPLGEAGGPPRPSGGRSHRGKVVLGVLGVVVLWMLAVGWLLAGARSSLESGRAKLEGVRAEATPSSLLKPATATDLKHAERDFAHARDRLRSPVITPLRLVPVVGRHIRAADHLVSSAQGSATLAATAVEQLGELADQPLAAGPQRIAALEQLSKIINQAREGLDDLDPGSPDSLASPLAKAVAKLAEERRQTQLGLAHAAQATDALTTVLKGPTPYLLIGANNAEMRAGSGMYLSAAPLGFDDGRLELGDVRPTQELVLPPKSVPVHGDLAKNWSWIDVGRDFRSMALSVDFPQSASVAAANWAKVNGGGPVGGVIVVDVDALRALLRVVGPVEVDGVRYTADTVRGELLRNQYRRYGDDRDQRRDQIGEVAKVVFKRIEAGHWKLDELATALVDTVSRRHLMVWSADPKVQAAWKTTSADGRLQDRSVAASLLNRGAEKLDSFLPTTAVLTSSTGSDGRVHVHLTYTITNKAPASGPKYLIGPNIAGLVAGQHKGIVVINLPGGATDVVVRGGRQTLQGADGPTTVVASEVSLLRGATAQVRVSATLPEGVTSVILEPSARIPPTVWTVDGTTYRLDRRRSLSVGD